MDTGGGHGVGTGGGHGVDTGGGHGHGVGGQCRILLQSSMNVVSCNPRAHIYIYVHILYVCAKTITGNILQISEILSKRFIHSSGVSFSLSASGGPWD